MLFKAILSAVVIASQSIVLAHTTMGFPRTRSHPLNENAVNIDYECIMAPLNGAPNGDGCPGTPFPCKGYPKDSQITQTLRAGQLIDVEFYNQNFPNGGQPGQEGADQARHSGGLCQFSLSLDGESFFVIAEYTRGCPDIYFDFPVRIPDDIPSADSAIFAWTWINASGNREFYMNCADVKLEGISGGQLSGKEITKANLPGTSGFEQTLTPDADVSPLSNSKGPGPTSKEVADNSARKGSNDLDNIVVDEPEPEPSADDTDDQIIADVSPSPEEYYEKPKIEDVDDFYDSTPGVDDFEEATPGYGDYTIQSTTRRKKCKIVSA